MLQFNDTTNYNGYVQRFEEEIGANYGDVSSNTTKLKQFTSRFNEARNKYLSIARQSCGNWQVDDSNHEDYNIIYINLEANQRDYVLNTDEQGNLIQDVYRVFVKNTSSDSYNEIYPIDVQSDLNTQSFTNGQETTGSVYRYDKTANALFLDPVPSTDVALGLKLYINREVSPVLYTDTTTGAGFNYHYEYFYLKPAFEYARINNLSSFPRLEKLILDLEGDVISGKVGLIAKAYSSRERDVRNILTMNYVNFR
jgi:hypothetical protein